LGRGVLWQGRRVVLAARAQHGAVMGADTERIMHQTIQKVHV
jgi:hypothetical protein